MERGNRGIYKKQNETVITSVFQEEIMAEFEQKQGLEDIHDIEDILFIMKTEAG